MNNGKSEEKTNADYLNIMANIVLTISIIATVVLILPNLIEVSAMINGQSTNSYTWTFIIWGGISLVIGISTFFLFRTISDIYRKVEK